MGGGGCVGYRWWPLFQVGMTNLKYIDVINIVSKMNKIRKQNIPEPKRPVASFGPVLFCHPAESEQRLCLKWKTLQ